MFMISKSILELFYEAAHIQRWNDHIRPQGFTELDKQAHKMIIAYLVAKYEENDRNAFIDWVGLIEGGIFEFLHRVVLTDIKPPVFHKLMAKHGDKLNRWVLDKLAPALSQVPGGFPHKFERYLFDPEYLRPEKRILKAAHYMATNWEFQIIYKFNSTLYGIEETRENIENELEEYYDLAGIQKIGLGKRTKNFIDFVGQLRFQQRWAQSPRVPETSVMGHMLIVAIFSYLCSVELEACKTRIRNNFYGGLFHDLPEVLTRDIVSPVKKAVEGFDEMLKEIERAQLEQRLLPLLPRSWHAELKYFIEDEFVSKIYTGRQDVAFVTSQTINETYNADEFNPLDGEIIRACDHLAAYIEASLSLSHGITSRHLLEAMEALHQRYNGRQVASLDFGQLFEYFRI
jgi:putative hydrolase of HD superfamily